MRTLLALTILGFATVAGAQAPLDPAKPDFTGIWRLSGYQSAVKLAGGKSPPLLPEAAKLYAERKAAVKRGDRKIDPSSACLPEGMPRLQLKAEPFELLQRPTLVAFNYQLNRVPRVVYLNEPPAPQDGDYYLGESRGNWDGAVLVIDTRGFNDITWLDDSGLPHGTGMKVTERLQLAPGGQRLLSQITVDDAEFYAQPWTVSVSYDRLKNAKLPEDVCAEKIGGSAPRSRK